MRANRSRPPAPSSRRAVLLAAGALIVATLAAYHNSFSGPFIYDDIAALVENPTIRHLHPLWPVLTPPASITTGGRPLLNLSFAINFAVSGGDSWSYHALNLLIHVLAGLTLLGVARRTLLQPRLRGRFEPAALPLALGIVALWTLHPLQTESVDYLVQRAESLMGLLYLATLYCFIRGTQSVRPGPWLALAVITCTLGMAAKEVMVSAPLLVLLYDRVFVAGNFREAWRQRHAFYAGLGATWILLAILIASTGGNRGGSVGFGVGVAWWTYGLTQFRAIAHYLWLSAWPFPQVFDYATVWVRHASEVVPYALVVVLLVAVAVIAWWRRPQLGFAGAWFFVILAPTSLAPGTTQIIVEHRLYLSLAALTALGATGLYAALGRRTWPVLTALALALGTLTARRNEDYRSALAIWTDTAAKSPANHRAHSNLGTALYDVGRLPEAVAEFQRALALLPDYAEAHTNLGHTLCALGRLPEAEAECREALRLQPDFAEAHINLGHVLVLRKQTPGALVEFETAVRLKPDSIVARDNLGNVLMEAGRLADAVAQFETVLQFQPGLALTHGTLGTALAQLGRTPEAIAHYEAALRLKPDYAEALFNLGNLLAGQGSMSEAIERFQAALRFRPDDPEAHGNLGNAFLQLDRLPEAIAQYEEALRLKPDYANAQSNLGLARARSGQLEAAVRHFETAVRMQPDFAQAHFYLGNALAALGRTAEAMREFEATLRLTPDFAPAREHLDRLRGTAGPPPAVEAKSDRPVNH